MRSCDGTFGVPGDRRFMENTQMLRRRSLVISAFLGSIMSLAISLVALAGDGVGPFPR